MQIPSLGPRLKLLGSIAVLMICYSWIVRPWLLRWGTTEGESAGASADQAVRAVTVSAPVERVWPWLMQIGQTRGGFYSYTWLENAFGCGMVNAVRIHPEWQSLCPGDKVFIDSPHRHNGQPYLFVASVEKENCLVVASPPDRMKTRNIRGVRALVWSFQLSRIAGGKTRLVARTTVETSRPVRWLLEPAHFLMERAMLLGIKTRAESLRLPAVAKNVDWRPFRERAIFGYVDSTGAVRIAPSFVEAEPFEQGRAVVATGVVAALGGSYEKRFGVIDHLGRFVIPPAFRYISHFREGLAVASEDGKSFGFIDSDGRWVLPPAFAEAADFESGLARVLPIGELSFVRVNTEGTFHPIVSRQSRKFRF